MAGLDDAASELESIARHLRRIGEGGLVRDLTAAMRRAADPVRGDIRAGLPPHLPDRYAAVLDDDLRISVSVRTSDRNPGVAVRATTRSGKRRRINRLDRGVLEHPRWGDRDDWYKQAVTPGWFTGPCQAAAPDVRAGIEQALGDVEAQATRKGP